MCHHLSIPIRVLHILGAVANGGVEAVIMNYYCNIDKNKIQFDFVVHSNADEDYINEVLAMGAKVYKVTPYNKNILKFMHEIYNIIKSNQYQIVHSNMNALSGFALLPACLAGAKVRILHNHTTDSKEEKLRSLIKRILRPFAKLFANHYWACSKLAAEWMYGKNAVINAKVTIINNAIDLEKFKFNNEKREILRKELDLEKCFVIGHVGRFMKQKNHEFLIDIFNEVLKQKENARLLLIGDGKLKPQIEEKVEKLGIKNAVMFLGNRNDVADLYNAMDVFVLPSLYEGLPVVGIEAQANGLPFICSDKVTEEIILTENIKLLSLKNKPQTWCEEILKTKRWYITTEKCRLKCFDIHSESKRLKELYLNIMEKNKK